MVDVAKQYESLLEYAQKIIYKTKHTLGVDASDIVNECVADVGWFDYEKVKSLLIKTATKITSINQIEHTRRLPNRSLAKENRQCKMCLNVYPMSEFPFTQYRIGHWEGHLNVCKKCKYQKYKDKQHIWQKNMQKNSSEYRLKTFLRVRKFWQKEKELLSDKYIERLVMRHKKYKKEELTDDFFTAYRAFLIKKKKKQIPKNASFKQHLGATFAAPNFF